MSNPALTWAFKKDVKPAGRKFVLVALADFADENHSCFPSVDRLASMTGQSEKSVRDHLNALEEVGLLARHRDRRADGTLTGYRYILPVDGGQRKISPSPAATLAITSGEICRSITPKTNPQEEPFEILKDFDDWWQHVLRKEGKKAAWDKYKIARRKHSAETLLDGIKRYSVHCQTSPVTETRFVKQPATWLHGEHWDDELTPKDGKPPAVAVDLPGKMIRPNTPQHTAWKAHYDRLRREGDQSAAFKCSMYQTDKSVREESDYPPNTRMEAAE